MKRKFLGGIGMRLAFVVFDFVRSGHVREAAWVERRLLNPIQRQLGATVSDYAEKHR